MTDRELLENAAKAAGYWICEPLRYGEFRVCNPEQNHLSFAWNPITDDGDALRLAVKLNMGISIPVHRTIRADVVCFQDSSISAREEGDDPCAATRRAIVRAAAEIGRGMP